MDIHIQVGFEVLTALSLTLAIFCVVAPFRIERVAGGGGKAI
jgi:hypothetical protein